MLYLEDYLEMIEHLPQELRDRFTEMRELDLTVQNSMDSLDKRSRLFFQQCKRGELQEESLDQEYNNLHIEYSRVMEDADEKISIAKSIHELVERYLRRLDSELFKFKCELEADNNGITEILEKRSLELDSSGSTAATALMNVIGMSHKENRYYGTPVALSSNSSGSSSIINNNTIGSSSVNIGLGLGSGSLANTGIGSSTNNCLAMSVNPQHRDNRHRKLEKRRETICSMPMVPEKRANLNHTMPSLANNTISVSIATNSSSGSSTVLPTAPVVNPVRSVSQNLSTHSVISSNASVASAPANNQVTYNLQQLGAGGAASNALAAAASQAIVATQQMQQGRRTASLKASYEAIHGHGVNPTEFWISRDIAASATVAAATAVAVNTHQALQSLAAQQGHHDKKHKNKPII